MREEYVIKKILNKIEPYIVFEEDETWRSVEQRKLLEDSRKEVEEGWILDPAAHLYLIKIKDERLRDILKNIVYTNDTKNFRKLMDKKEKESVRVGIGTVLRLIQILDLFNERDDLTVSIVGTDKGNLLKLSTENMDIIIAGRD